MVKVNKVRMKLLITGQIINNERDQRGEGYGHFCFW